MRLRRCQAEPPSRRIQSLEVGACLVRLRYAFNDTADRDEWSEGDPVTVSGAARFVAAQSVSSAGRNRIAEIPEPVRMGSRQRLVERGTKAYREDWYSVECRAYVGF